MRGYRTKIIVASILCAFACILTGCPKGLTEEERAEGQRRVEQAMAIAEEPIRQYYPNVDLSKYYIWAHYNSEFRDYTDWVGGYATGSEEFEGFSVNIVTKEIYVSYEWPRMNAYVEKLFKDLYQLNQFDNNDIEYSINGYKSVPAYVNDPEKDDWSIHNELPLGVFVDDDFCRDFLDSGEYSFTFSVKVSENVNMKLFKEADVTALGSNAHVYVEQYSNEVFHDETKRYSFDKTKRDLIGEKTIEQYVVHSKKVQNADGTESKEAIVEDLSDPLSNDYFEMVAITADNRSDDTFEVTFTFRNVSEKAYFINGEKITPYGIWKETISYAKTKWREMSGKKNWIHYKLYDEKGNLIFSGGFCFVVDEEFNVTDMEVFEEQ